MKKILLILALLACNLLGIAQSITLTDSVSHLVYRQNGVYRAMPKRDISTEFNDPFLTVRYKYETLFRISSNAVVTTPSSTSMTDLRNKITALIAESSGGGSGGIGANDAVTFTNKTMAWGSNTFTGFPFSQPATTETLTNKTIDWSSNTFTNFPFVGLTGNQTIAGNKTFSGSTSLTGSITVGASMIPSNAASFDLGSTTLRFGTVYASNVLNPSAFLGYIGTTTATTPFYFRQGTTTQIPGGFFGTGQVFFQAPGAAPTSTGEQVQVTGTMKVTGQINTSADLLFNDNGEGPIIKSTPGGVRWRIIVSDAGALSTVAAP